jgi:hypothetical protein
VAELGKSLNYFASKFSLQSDERMAKKFSFENEIEIFIEK